MHNRNRLYGIELKSEETMRYGIGRVLRAVAQAGRLRDVNQAAAETRINPEFLFGAVLGSMVVLFEYTEGVLIDFIGGNQSEAEFKGWLREAYKQWDSRLNGLDSLAYPMKRVSVTSPRRGRVRVPMSSKMSAHYSFAHLRNVAFWALKFGSVFNVPNTSSKIEPEFLRGWAIFMSCYLKNYRRLCSTEPLPLQLRFDSKALALYRELDSVLWESATEKVKFPDQAA